MRKSILLVLSIIGTVIIEQVSGKFLSYHEHNKHTEITDYNSHSNIVREPKLHNYKMVQFNGSDIVNVPDSFDWRQKGAISPVKNQGQMGQASIYTAVDSIESAHFIKAGKLLSLSEEQVEDCDQQAESVIDVYNYASTHALELAQDYGSIRSQGACHYDPAKGVVEVKKVVKVKPNDSEELKKAVTQSPVTVVINAGTMEFQTYQGGIFNPKNCPAEVDHTLLVVGYGKEGDQGYWICKNTWGNSWGESGYIRIAMTDGPGVCGINLYGAYPQTD
ncbi:cysteine protease [Stylonychia lemnae]|uniref:Cysteine protease n=1 Tax=Stylonychia lemnae TaxID=5949 RepID=A0A077ZSP9_STYLE|nr:cysteine protease [Stylonychia lemnae]|eukprot:CDW72335.1 cysteine protease [Stylonychia lemnae]